MSGLSTSNDGVHDPERILQQNPENDPEKLIRKGFYNKNQKMIRKK
jgi:hypothetical protein